MTTTKTYIIILYGIEPKPCVWEKKENAICLDNHNFAMSKCEDFLLRNWRVFY